MTERTTRHFICKRCGKPSTDKMGGFEQYSQKHDIVIVYENVDLCPKCFKKTVKEERSVKLLQELISKGYLDKDDKEALKKFQTDKLFKKEILIKAGFIKTKVKNKRHPPSYYRRLVKREEERKNERK